MTAFLSWWYGPGWKAVALSLNSRLQAVSGMFSVAQLVKTIFAPWRRIISYPGASLEDKFHAWIDNLFSRTVGFFVRLIVLFTAMLVAAFVLIITVLEIFLWPVIPAAPVVLIILGIVL